jgi:alpha-glucosidase
VGRTNNLGPEAANLGVNKAVMREAVLFQMTWAGAPTIYYGDEAGVCGWTDPDNRRTYPWGHEDREMIAFHKAMIRIHKQNQEFIDGSIKYVMGEHNVLGYGRMRKGQCSMILLNNSDGEITKEIPVWYLGTPMEGRMVRLMLTTAEGFDDTPEEVEIVAGRVVVTLPKTSAIVLKYRPEPEQEQEEKTVLEQKLERLENRIDLSFAGLEHRREHKSTEGERKPQQTKKFLHFE